MTTAKLLPQLPKGHGLREDVNSAAYQDMIAARPSQQQVLIVVIEPQQIIQAKTADGIHQTVGWQIRRLSLLQRDLGDDVDRALAMAEQADARNVFPDDQRLPFSDDRDVLLTLLQTWADDTGRDLDAEWAVQFGDEFVAPIDKASLIKLQEFAALHEVIADSPIVDGDVVDCEIVDVDEQPVEDVALPAFVEPESVSS